MEQSLEGGRSPMISPRVSPQLLRRATAPPPPLPPRKASPVFGNPANSISCNQLTVPNEEAPPPPRTSPSPSETKTTQETKSASSTNGPTEDTRYEVPPTQLDVTTPAMDSTEDAKVTGELLCGGSSLPTMCEEPSAPPLELTAATPLHYAHMVETPDEPNYENTLILPGNIIMVKPIYSCTPIVEQPKISASTPLVKTALPDRLNLDLKTSTVHPSPSRASSLDSQTSQGSVGAAQHSPTHAYENLNMDHIAKLTSKGYSQEAVIRALGITRNDLNMASDILNEFATKQT